jgi:type VI secretion system secreted protein VgrG
MHLRPYDDQTGADIDHWVPGATIGYGHLIAQNQWNQFASGITEDQGNLLFESDLQPFVDTVNGSLTREVAQNQFDAMVILCFNIGQAAFGQSTALRLINDPPADSTQSSVDAAWRSWNRSQGRVNHGLENRRNAELDLYNNGNYGE